MDDQQTQQPTDGRSSGLAQADGSAELRRHFPKLSVPRKPQSCRLCGTRIDAGEQCCRWSTVERGEGYQTSHAHPECFQYTLDAKWDAGDWECMAPGDISRPNNQIT